MLPSSLATVNRLSESLGEGVTRFILKMAAEEMAHIMREPASHAKHVKTCFNACCFHTNALTQTGKHM